MTPDEAIANLLEAADEWRAGAPAVEVVRAACDVLVAGHDGMAMATLAGVEYAEAKDKVADFVVEALAEVSVPFFLPGSDAEQLAWLTSMADRFLRGTLSPRELAAATWSAIGSDGCAASERLVDLAFEYYLADKNDADAWDPTMIDAEVVAEAQRLTRQA